MQQGQVLTPWMHRRWRFDFPAELHPAIIERLRGAPDRAAALAEELRPGEATRIPEGGWSVQRHLAHLADLEALLHARLDAYERGEPALPAADMSNRRTTERDHEARTLASVLEDLRRVRGATIARLEEYPRDFFGRSAWHERLGVQKRVVDTCVFFADHDDHHFALARMALRDARGR